MLHREVSNKNFNGGRFRFVWGADGATVRSNVDRGWFWCATMREESSVVNNYRQLSDTMQPLPYNRVDNRVALYGVLYGLELIACEI